MLALALPLLACDVASEPTERREPLEAADAIDAGIASALPVDLAAAGWIELDGSPIRPWCGAVLVAPDVAVTSAACVEGWNSGFLAVGFGQIGRGTLVRVEQVIVDADAAEPGLALAALQLDAPVRGVDPVELVGSQLRHTTCGVESISYRYVLEGEESERWSWSGCVGPDGEAWMTAMDGAPNCHGDLGAGAFLRDGDLLGIVVDARGDGGCVGQARLATVAANEKFFDAALELSRL